MRCPECRSPNTCVKDSHNGSLDYRGGRNNKRMGGVEDGTIARNRRCCDCSRQWRTLEMNEADAMPTKMKATLKEAADLLMRVAEGA